MAKTRFTRDGVVIPNPSKKSSPTKKSTPATKSSGPKKSSPAKKSKPLAPKKTVKSKKAPAKNSIAARTKNRRRNVRLSPDPSIISLSLTPDLHEETHDLEDTAHTHELLPDEDREEMHPAEGRDDGCPDEELNAPESDDDADDADGIGVIQEETCRDLSVYFGDEARNDDCEAEEDIGDEYAWDDDKIPDPLSSDEENEEEMRPSEAYRQDVDPEELLQLGKTFSDADDFKHACLRYTLKTRFNIKYYRSTSLKMGAMCAATMREDEAPCPWKIYCSYERKKQRLQIKTYVNVHTCEVTGESKILQRSAIAELFKERLRLNPKITAKEIREEIRREYKMEVKENSCIKAKTKLMRQRRKTHEAHFDRIWDYQAEVIRSNCKPGDTTNMGRTTFEIETIPGAHIGAKQRFNRLYICFQAQKEAWKRTCRPVIGLDGAFLKWDIKGQLLAAVGRDGDNRIVPIAWAVVEIENDVNWDWFVKLLAVDLELGTGTNYVLVSDKQKGLVKAIHTVLPDAEHRQCCRHIYDNWRRGGKDLKLQKLFWFIAKSYTQGLYNYNMEALKEHDAGAYASLLLTKPETWSRAFFKLGSRCNDVLNNLSESFNRTIKEARKKPLLDLLEDIRQQCMTRNYKRARIAASLTSRFTKKTMKELSRVEKKSTECRLRWAIGPETEVDYKGHTYVVSMETQSCACRSWQLNGIPCIHAAKVILGLGKKLSEYVDECYTTIRWRETYNFGIKPLNGQMEWPQTNRLGVIPPPNRNGNPGRPRSHARMKSMFETGSNTKLSRANRIMTCSNCKEQGHNKLTCKNAAVADPPKNPKGRPKKNQVLQSYEYFQAQASYIPWDNQPFSEGQSSQPQPSWEGQSSQPQPSWEAPPFSQGQASQAQWEIPQEPALQGWRRWFQ